MRTHMKPIKITIDNSSYMKLFMGEKNVQALCINDWVSTVPHDSTTGDHEYHTRHHLVQRFMRLSNSHHIRVVCPRHHEKITVVLNFVEGGETDKLSFTVNCSALSAEEVVKGAINAVRKAARTAQEASVAEGGTK